MNVFTTENVKVFFFLLQRRTSLGDKVQVPYEKVP